MGSTVPVSRTTLRHIFCRWVSGWPRSSTRVKYFSSLHGRNSYYDVLWRSNEELNSAWSWWVFSLKTFILLQIGKLWLRKPCSRMWIQNALAYLIYHLWSGSYLYQITGDPKYPDRVCDKHMSRNSGLWSYRLNGLRIILYLELWREVSYARIDM